MKKKHGKAISHEKIYINSLTHLTMHIYVLGLSKDGARTLRKMQSFSLNFFHVVDTNQGKIFLSKKEPQIFLQLHRIFDSLLADFFFKMRKVSFSL